MRHVLLPVALATAVALVWEVGTRIAHVSPMILVPPSAVWEVIAASFPILMQQAVPTVAETVIGFLLAAVVGMLLGTLLVLSNALRRALYPHVLLFQLIPKIAIAPLFIVWFGVGSSSRLCLAVFMAFFPVVVATATGLVSADRQMLRLAEATTASTWQIFRHVRLPYALPHLFAGLKVALTLSMIGVIVGEFVTAQAGLGYIVTVATSSAETSLALAAIVLLCAVGLVLYGLLAALEWWVGQRLGVSITTNEF
jgi:NitT/TauT family transport system permease protein